MLDRAYFVATTLVVHLFYGCVQWIVLLKYSTWSKSLRTLILPCKCEVPLSVQKGKGTLFGAYGRKRVSLYIPRELFFLSLDSHPCAHSLSSSLVKVVNAFSYVLILLLHIGHVCNGMILVAAANTFCMLPGNPQ